MIYDKRILERIIKTWSRMVEKSSTKKEAVKEFGVLRVVSVRQAAGVPYITPTAQILMAKGLAQGQASQTLKIRKKENDKKRETY